MVDRSDSALAHRIAELEDRLETRKRSPRGTRHRVDPERLRRLVSGAIGCAALGLAALVLTDDLIIASALLGVPALLLVLYALSVLTGWNGEGL